MGVADLNMTGNIHFKTAQNYNSAYRDIPSRVNCFRLTEGMKPVSKQLNEQKQKYEILTDKLSNQNLTKAIRVT